MQRSTLSSFLSVAVLVLATWSCKKEKVATKPSLTLKESSSKEVPFNGSFLATFGYTDKEGDADTLFVIRKRLNVRGPETKAPLDYAIPQTSGEAEGELATVLYYVRDLTLNFSRLGTAANPEPDTLKLLYILKDKKKNTSDTVTIDGVIVTRH
jgi:hypothetical protein